MTSQPSPRVGEPKEVSASFRAESASKNRVKVALASYFGTLVEFYDFQIYGVAAALVFPTVLFPALGAAAATFASVATFGVAFIARPLGSILFGHFGDRLGRKKMLVITLVMMGVATVAIGLIPPATQIGVAAPIIVVFLRVLQGLAAGGEWAGAALFAGEYAPPGRRGRWTLFTQLGPCSAVVLTNATFLLTGVFWAVDSDDFLAWGWRIPFIASSVLVAFGLWVRLSIDETPVFKHEISKSGRSRVPFIEAFKHQPRMILLTTGASLVNFSLFYIWTVYLANYSVSTLGLPRTFVLWTSLFAGLVMVVGATMGALLSDRIGRRAVILGVSVSGAVFSLVAFPLVETDSKFGLIAVYAVMAFIGGVHFGPLAAFIPEQFATRYRYTASGLVYGLASLLGGAVIPLAAPTIVRSFGSFTLGALLSVLCAIAAVCAYSLKESKSLDLATAGVDERAR